MKDDILARIDAALTSAETVRRYGVQPSGTQLERALREARAEIVRLSALIPEPPTDVECSNPKCPLRYAHDGPCAPEGWEPPTDDEREDADREALAQTIGAVVVDYEDTGPHSQRAITLRDVCEMWPDEIAAEVVASPVWRNRGRGPITDEVELHRLSDSARPGPWKAYETTQADNFIVEASQGLLNGPGPVMGPSYDKSTVEYVVALVNAHRAALGAGADQTERGQ